MLGVVGVKFENGQIFQAQMLHDAVVARNMLRSNVAIVWPENANTGPAMLG